MAAAVRQAAGKNREALMALIHYYFKPAELDQISAVCTQVEQQTAGEVRVSIFNKRPFGMRRLTIQQVATAEFKRLKMDQTRDHTGILLMLILKEHRFQILADTGINARVPQTIWDEIASKLAESFRQGRYLPGIVDAIHAMGAILAQHFPRRSDDTNEIADEVVVH